jgi:hypothetical protein
MQQPQTASAVPDRAALRAELEATRAGFHELMDAVSDADWKTKSANPAWTVGQLIYHMAWAVGFMRGEVKSTMKGKGLNPPNFIINPLNVFNTKFGAMRASRASIARKYDAATADLVAMIDTIGDGDWQRSATTFGVTQTVEHIFHVPAEHLAEHSADIRTVLTQ